MSSVQPGQVIQHYKIIEKIGEGGMGEVYKAEDTKLGRQVALKILPPDTQEEKNAKRRLLQEARAASALNHPNIVTIHSIEEADGFTFIVMEYVIGETLKSIIERGAMESSRLVDLGSQIADALAAAHAAGFIHRDIKPSNILVTSQGQAKILDFGLAKLTQISDQSLSGEQTMSRLTKTGIIVGTVAYMSPEQTRGESLDARTDIFSLGCVLYEAATGKVPFSGPSVLSVLHEIATVDPPAPSTLSDKVPQGLDTIIKRALAKDRDQRYGSSSELANALRGLTFANRYQILRELGRGGMGVVHLAHDPLLERDVAIKVISPDLLSADAVERFRREARLIAKMDHPSIVGIHDIGDDEGSLFLVMPFAQGSNLRNLLNEQSLSLGEVVDIGIQVAEALEYSHTREVVHRDIKPENIIVAKEPEGIRARVTDFGLATASTEHRLTRTGSFVGTIAYLSPEQLSTKIIDSRSDIYSLGIVLYECLTGQPPFTGEVQSVLYRIAHEIPEPPRAVGADIQEELEDIVMRCLEKDPAKRPQHAKEVADALVRFRARLRESQKGQKLSTVHGLSIQAHRPAAAPLIARDKEFAELQRKLNSAIRGECQFVLLAGEAGVGKSRLLEELENLVRARNIRVLHSRFVGQDQAFPYQGFCESIQEYFQLKMAAATSGPVDFSDLAPDLVALFPVLAEIGEITGGQKVAVSETKKIQDRTYIYDLLARSFVRIGGSKPLVLVFEDLHNAEVSVDALQYVVRRLGPTPTLVVGTYRTTEVDKSHPITTVLDNFHGDRRFTHMILSSFTSAEHRIFLESMMGGSRLDESFAKRLFEATEGNAYFTQELVRSLIDSEAIAKDESGGMSIVRDAEIAIGTLPATIQQTIERRIKRLPEDLREILSIASILGRTFEFRDLELLTEGKENLEDKLDKLIDSGFLEEDRASRGDLLSFSSGVLHDVLHADVPRRRRRSLHRRYAEELERRNSGRLDRVYPQLVHHYSEGDVPEKVIQFGPELARRSLDTLSAEDAMRAARTVLDFVGEDEDAVLEGEVRSILAQAYRMAGNLEEALQELESAIRIFERKKDTSLVVRALVLAAEMAWEGRRVDETKAWVERGLDIAAATEDKDSLQRLLSLGATVANLRGEYDRARVYLEQSERLKPAVKEKEEIPTGGQLSVAIPAPIATLVPVETNILEENEIGGNVFETLLSMDDQGHLVPHLCESWEVLEEGKSFLFTLRPNVLLHNGEPITAGQIKSDFEKAVRASHDRLPASMAPILGVTAFLEGSSDHVNGITAQSKDKLRIELREALPIYPSLLIDPRVAISHVDAPGSQLLGTGPFRIKSHTEDRVVLERNDNYWKGNKASLETIEFHCGVTSARIASGLRSGEFDLASDLSPDDLEQILQDRRFRAGLVEAPKKNVYFVMFNQESKVCNIPEIRKALCGLVRSDDVVRSTLGRLAQPAEGMLPPGILGHDPGRRRHLLLLEDALALMQSTGLSFPLRLKASVHPILQDRYGSLTEALFKIWAELGIEISIVTTDMASFLETDVKSEGIDMRIGRWAADYDDPDDFTHFLFDSEVGIFRRYYSSSDLDKVMREARLESRPEIREKLYRKIELMMEESDFLLPLFHDIDYRVSSARVVGLKLTSSPPFVNYEELGKMESITPTAARKSGGGIIHVPYSVDFLTIDPSQSVTIQQNDAIANVFENLTRQLEGARIVPWLASEFHPEEGGKRFRFRLRTNVRFHDGRRLTARDVRYSFERLLQNPESQSRWLLAPIRGAKELIGGKRKELIGVRLISSSEFTIDLEEPVSFFPAILAYPSAAIVPEGTEELQGSWRTGCVGTGPFRVVRFDQSQLELETNPDYWLPGLPKSDGLVFTFGVPPAEILSGFRSGRFSLAGDLIPSEVESLRHDSEFAHGYREIPQLGTYYIVFNTHNGPFSDEKLRHELLQAIDVPGLVRRTVGRLAAPAHSLVAPGLLGYEPGRTVAFSPSSKEKRKTSVEVTGTIHTIYQGTYAALAGEIFAAFQRKGFRVRQDDRALEQYFKAGETVGSAVDFIMSRWTIDYPDTDSFVHSLLHSQNGIHGNFCGTPEVDRLIERGRMETNPEVRHDIYREIEQIVARRALVLPLFHEQIYRFARPEVQGFEFAFNSVRPVPYEKIWIQR